MREVHGSEGTAPTQEMQSERNRWEGCEKGKKDRRAGINEMNAEEGSEGGKKEPIGVEKRQEEKEGTDRKRRLEVGRRRGRAEGEEEINSFVDLLLCCYLKSNAFSPQSFFPSS